MKTSVEWYCEKSIDILEELRAGKMTFTEWFKEQAVILKQAKEMEKEQVIEARNNGFMASAEGWNGEYGIKDFNLLTEEIKSEEYFNKTFKTK
jgi:hypothetical protein